MLLDVRELSYKLADNSSFKESSVSDTRKLKFDQKHKLNQTHIMISKPTDDPEVEFYKALNSFAKNSLKHFVQLLKARQQKHLVKEK